MFLIKLRRILQYNNIPNHLYLICLGVILTLLVFLRFNYIYLLALVIYIIMLIIINIKYFIITLIIVTIPLMNLLIRSINYNKISYGDIYIKAQVINIEHKTSNYKVTVKSERLKHIFYTEDSFSVGDNIYIKGTLTQGDINHSDNLFNYRRYLQDNNIKGIIEIEKIKIINNTFTFSKMNEKCNNYYNKHFDTLSRGYLKALLIGTKNDLDSTLQTSIQQIGIGHLFVISGLHMNVLKMILEKVLSLIKLKPKYHFYIITIFFILYFVLTCRMISILRVLLIYIFSYINKKLKLKLSTLDIYMLTIILILSVNPYYLVSYAFLLTFIISTSLVIINPLIRLKGFIGGLINNIIISINSIIVTIPIIISINPTINLLSIIYNLIYIPFVSYVLLPLSIIVTILPFVSFIYQFIVSIFSSCTIFLSNLKFANLSFNVSSKIIYIFYYLSYIYLIKTIIQKRTKHIKIVSILFLLLIITWNNIIRIDIYDEIYFIDLPEGEATLIKKAFDKCNILIDTGENNGDDLELFLKKKGIKRLDYIYITHSDSDHNGKLAMLIEEFKVKNIVINKYDKITKEIIQSTNYKNNIIMVKRGNIINYKDIYVKVLLPDIDTKDSNNNSLVLYIKVFNSTMLLTGDIESSQENKLASLEKKIKVDFFKVPHHGSLTSSSNNLLKILDYDYVICMSGYKNTFGFPNINVIKRYDEDKLYLTSERNTIVFRKPYYSSDLKYKI